jgi:hypothetical protein
MFKIVTIIHVAPHLFFKCLNFYLNFNPKITEAILFVPENHDF